MDRGTCAPELCVNKFTQQHKYLIMDSYILHKAATRGKADHGWLNSYQTFSFAGYYNPQRIHFGALRVLNDDTVEGGKGFGSHPHDNMEIISIPLEGALEHKDNMGNTKVVQEGEIQVMSTGKGIFHSEYNAHADRPAKFLQIWVFPNQLNVAPRYDQVPLLPEKLHNKLYQVISPDPQGEGTWLHQDAWFSIGRFDKGHQTTYQLQKSGNGIYFFVINGSFTIDNQLLESRDGLGVQNTDVVTIIANDDKAELLVMDVPMIIPSNN